MPQLGKLKKQLQQGEVVVGPFVIIPSVPLIDTLGHAGMDFCIIDTEHGPVSPESATDLVIAAQGTGVAPIIRVGANEERLILRTLDIGADGVQVPQINTIEDAQRVIHAAKYAPLGARGMSVFTRAGDYYAGQGVGHTDKQNDETMIVVHIEGQRGLDNLDEIMTVEGIDVLFLGPYDISQSLGVPGDVRSAKVEAALKEAAGKARAKGRAVGSYAKDVEMGKWLIDLGVQYLSINVDATIYMQACEQIARALK
ncbi:MAG: HpcH/HpaI aldolase family protein [Alphaproteobacteria bacterium]